MPGLFDHKDRKFPLDNSKIPTFKIRIINIHIFVSSIWLLNIFPRVVSLSVLIIESFYPWIAGITKSTRELKRRTSFRANEFSATTLDFLLGHRFHIKSTVFAISVSGILNRWSFIDTITRMQGARFYSIYELHFDKLPDNSCRIFAN